MVINKHRVQWHYDCVRLSGQYIYFIQNMPSPYQEINTCLNPDCHRHYVLPIAFVRLLNQLCNHNAHCQIQPLLRVLSFVLDCLFDFVYLSSWTTEFILLLICISAVDSLYPKCRVFHLSFLTWKNTDQAIQSFEMYYLDV